MATETTPSWREDEAGDATRQQRVRRAIDEVLRRRSGGESVSDQDVIAVHSELMPELGKELSILRRIENARRTASVDGGQRGQAGESAASIGTIDASDAGSPDGGSGERHAPPPHLTIPGYELSREISRGGQAVVFLGRQASTGRRVAVKVMREGPFASDKERARFDREVQILASLEHPNIVSIIDRGVAADGSHFFAMNYVDGPTLDAWLHEYRQAHPVHDVPEDPGELLRLFVRICAAVEAAHQCDVVHRDLKPSNIRIDTRGEPHILDFGLARAILPMQAEDTAPPLMTVTGAFLGSLPWASPEQAEGRPDRIDPRTDVYSLGVILYQMLTGQFPYEVVGNMRDVLDNIMRAEPTPPSRVIAARLAKREQGKRRWRRRHANPINGVIEAIVLKALSKQREKRYASAGELAADINSYLAGKPTIAIGERVETSRNRRRIAAWTGTLAASLLLLIAIALNIRGGAEPTGPTPGATAVGDGLRNSPPPEVVASDFSGLAHDGEAIAAAFDAEGSVLASVGRDRRIRLWSIPSGAAIAAIPVTHDIGGVALSPDGKLVAAWAEGWYSGGNPHRWQVSIFDVGSQQPARLFADPADVIGPVAFSPDRKTIAAGGADYSIQLWNIETGRRAGQLTGHASGITALAFSPDGSLLASGDRGKICKAWDIPMQRELNSFDDLDRGGLFPHVHSVAFAGPQSFVAGVKANLFQYDAKTGQARDLGRHHAFAVAGLAVGPDGLFIAACGRQGDGNHAVIYEASTGRRLTGIRGLKGANGVAFDPKGRWLVTAGPGRELQVWKVADWERQ